MGRSDCTQRQDGVKGNGDNTIKGPTFNRDLSLACRGCLVCFVLIMHAARKYCYYEEVKANMAVAHADMIGFFQKGLERKTATKSGTLLWAHGVNLE
jgi:hypothetical protein